MRETKFRGFGLWKDCKRWFYGDLLHYTDGTVEIVEKRNQIRMFNYAVDPKSIGEYTGMTDKNGKEIYEGDIIRSDGHTWEDKFTASVEFDKGMFWDSYWHYPIASAVSMEVIGNVWENADLLV